MQVLLFRHVRAFALATTLLSLSPAYADVGFDATRTQLNVAKNVAERLRARLAEPEGSPSEVASLKRRLNLVQAQITELSRRLGLDSPAGTVNSRGQTASARTESARPREAVKRDPRYYILKSTLLGKSLQWVHVIKTENGQATVADALDSRYQRNDTIRTVDAHRILVGTLDAAYEDVLLTTGVFGTKRTLVTVLELVGEYAIVADGWDLYRTDTIRTVKASALEDTARREHAFECDLALLTK